LIQLKSDYTVISNQLNHLIYSLRDNVKLNLTNVAAKNESTLETYDY